jgi:hypothetical protein
MAVGAINFNAMVQQFLPSVVKDEKAQGALSQGLSLLQGGGPDIASVLPAGIDQIAPGMGDMAGDVLGMLQGGKFDGGAVASKVLDKLGDKLPPGVAGFAKDAIGIFSGKGGDKLGSIMNLASTAIPGLAPIMGGISAVKGLLKGDLSAVANLLPGPLKGIGKTVLGGAKKLLGGLFKKKGKKGPKNEAVAHAPKAHKANKAPKTATV